MPLVLAAALVTVLLAPAGTASASPPGSDGKIYACYRVKGKPKGALRVVRSAGAHCRRGERKTSWAVAGGGAQSGGRGATGATGKDGAAASADEAALKAQIGALNLRVQALEGILQGITNGDLTGMLATLQGLNNEELLSAVSSLPAVAALCEQSEGLTEQVNQLGTGLGSLVSVLKGTILGSIFGTVTIPSALEPFTCPTN